MEPKAACLTAALFAIGRSVDCCFRVARRSANKQKFIEHANKGDSVFIELGATRILECWGDDVPTAS